MSTPNLDQADVLPRLVILASELDRRQLSTLSWAGVALFHGLLENVRDARRWNRSSRRSSWAAR